MKGSDFLINLLIEQEWEEEKRFLFNNCEWRRKGEETSIDLKSLNLCVFFILFFRPSFLSELLLFSRLTYSLDLQTVWREEEIT